ncbi:MAG: polyphosphate kinase 2 (PPK2 family) [Halieaceae bacterium]|jgi:polyphosphate kinase 2 (PPK2 family)
MGITGSNDHVSPLADPDASKQQRSLFYLKELRRLYVELITVQESVKRHGLKVVVIFEGRDAAGKGGVIKRISEPLNPRVCQIMALGTPSEREKSQWYFQPGEVLVLRIGRGARGALSR